MAKGKRNASKAVRKQNNKKTLTSEPQKAEEQAKTVAAAEAEAAPKAEAEDAVVISAEVNAVKEAEPAADSAVVAAQEAEAEKDAKADEKPKAEEPKKTAKGAQAKRKGRKSEASKGKAVEAEADAAKTLKEEPKAVVRRSGRKSAGKAAVAKSVETAEKTRKKPGPAPKTPEQKEAARKEREEQKRLAANMRPVIKVQYGGKEINPEELAESIKADYQKEHKRELITSIEVYLVPEQNKAYYVINGKEFPGKDL